MADCAQRDPAREAVYLAREDESLKKLTSLKKIRLTKDQRERMSHVADSLRIGDQGTAKENWSYIIQSLVKTKDTVSENDINNLVQQAISKSQLAISIIGDPSPEVLEKEIRALGEKLNTAGDDANLANVDLQNELQKQQRTLQMISNISKMLYDTATAMIRKIGG